MFYFDCFAMVNGECSITDNIHCMRCRFYKTRQQYEKDLKKSKERAESLGYYQENTYSPKGFLL